jgi:hypothetical protein
MSQSTTAPRMVEINAAVDADLLARIDAIVAQFPGLDRNGVIDEALRMWYRHERALERQFAPPLSDEDRAEREAWRSIQAAAAERIFRPR